MDIWKTNKKCPKCGSRNFQIVDYCSTPLLYECEDGVITANGQGDSGELLKRVCICRECETQWTPRGEVFTNHEYKPEY